MSKFQLLAIYINNHWLTKRFQQYHILQNFQTLNLARKIRDQLECQKAGQGIPQTRETDKLTNVNYIYRQNNISISQLNLAKGETNVCQFTFYRMWEGYCSSGSSFLHNGLLVWTPLSYPLLSPDSLTPFSINLPLIPLCGERPCSLPALRSWSHMVKDDNLGLSTEINVSKHVSH